jgi:hypothetical protein
MEEKEIQTLSSYDNFMFALKEKRQSDSIQTDLIDFLLLLEPRDQFRKSAINFLNSAAIKNYSNHI